LLESGEVDTVVLTGYLGGYSAMSDELRGPETDAEVIAFDWQVAEEDVALVQAVQKGLDSRTVLQGKLMTESERLIVSFQRNVREVIA
jgi:hypothetical protein